MSQVSWLIDNRVILIDMGVTVTKEELIKINSDIIDLLEASDSKPVHILFIADVIKKFPSNVSWLREIMSFVHHPSRGYHVTVTDNAVLRFIGSIIYKVSGMRAPYIVSTYDEARYFLGQVDDTLPELPELPG